MTRPDATGREAVEERARSAHEAWVRAGGGGGAAGGPPTRPWDKLTDAERAYARHLVTAAADADAAVADVAQLDGLARSFTGLELEWLLAHWGARDADAWARYPEVYYRLAKRLRALGHPLLAHEVAREGAVRSGDAGRAAWLRHEQAVALARAGAYEGALRVLRGIGARRRTDRELVMEVASLEGRVWKDRGLATPKGPRRRAHFAAAFKRYEFAYRHAPVGKGSFPAVNAAALALWLGEEDRAREFAGEARRLAEREHEADSVDPWPLATLAEAALILGERNAAERWYGEAVRLMGDRIGDVASMRRQARLHAPHRGLTTADVDGWIPVPPVVVFAGHMIDRPGRPAPRFPPAAADAIASEIEKRLEALHAGVGFAGAACGSDLLFLEAMERRGAHTHVVLPFGRDLFVRESVAIHDDGGWQGRFEHAVARATAWGSCDELTGATAELKGLAFEYANMVLLGLALLKSQELQTELVGLAVYDERPPDGPGGTADTVRVWRTLERKGVLRVESVNPLAVAPAAVLATPPVPVATPPSAGPAELQRPDAGHRIAGVLFADVEKFSEITAQGVLKFFEVFLGEVGRLLAAAKVPPLVRNTWGDGLFLVFPKVSVAGAFALDLCAAMEGISWAEHDLPAGLAVRVGVHAGPLFEFVDRVTGQLTLSGRHVTQAARIEPVTPRGMVYATQEFAALAAAYGDCDFTCEPVGRVLLAKAAGHAPLYALRRGRGPDVAAAASGAPAGEAGAPRR